MAILGRRNLLPILRETPPGLYLDGGDLGDILLPRRYLPPIVVVGESLDVFVYRDSEDRLVATTETPLAMVGDFALLRVLSVLRGMGAFLDWGLSKDLLLPRQEQLKPVREGGLVVVRLFVHEETHRIVASSQLDRWLGTTAPAYTEEQAVEVFITGETPLGYNAIIEKSHWGLLYHTEVSSPLRPGDTHTAYVRNVRADGKIDLALDRVGYGRVRPLSEQILSALAEAGGVLPLHDKTPPEEIRRAFGVSKKTFKQALGQLYREESILLEPTQISLRRKAVRR